MKRTAVHGPGAKAKPAPTSKYVHQRHATARKPKAAPAADDNSQSLPATPKATATTDSPKTIIVNSAKRSGMWLAWSGTRPTNRGPITAGTPRSTASPIPHTTKRHGSGTASETVHSATLKLNAAT